MIDTVRNFAIDWQDWASQQDMSYAELTEWTSAIEQLAVLAQGNKKDGELIEELKENGVL